ncbi:uncharacterized protein PV09_00306 [Verruconis gallopava]|uniref:E3 ubiquitin protein ligase n=1 Tax=Verruconis gallopava TaxID=253628 RepID=A0A0D1Y328_9PEZI|nr:uncharacterized protein PV09_00306 [Verruconis gallopava]KIW09416.1 hypothetical protein PV09_00306 [Verruconis gallopava]
MSVATIQPALPVGKPKMDNERKRAATAGELEDSAAPPSKKQATMSNGAASGEAADAPKFGSINSTWQVDLETFQKDAILRQMKEYKREKQDLEKSLRALEDQSRHYKENLRMVDAWWKQVIDEVVVLSGGSPDPSTSACFETSSLLSVDAKNFQEHLASRSDGIKKVISAIYSKIPASTSPDVQALQKRVNELLAQEKGYINECQRLNEELELAKSRLDDASFRYMVAERKLDKAKSNVVANIEKQGTLGSSVSKQDSDEKANGDTVNGIKSEASAAASEAAERERAEAVAVAAKAKEQLAQLEEQNAKLTTELTRAKARLDSLTDEDYAGTELFKIMKSKLEESLHKINDLEAKHIELREEAKKAQAERTAYRTKIDDEAMAATSSTEQLLAARDADLQRVRAARDDAHFKAAALEQSQHDHKATAESAVALANAREARIHALESEVERLKIRCSEIHADVPEDETSDVSQLQQKVADLRRECKTLESELPSIEQAYKKAQAAAAAKFSAYEQMDQQLAALKMAKVKADQKYFGMMKYKEQLEAEVNTLRKADKTSSGIIASLKNSDSNSKELVVNLERQVAEHLDTIERMTQERFGLEAKANQAAMSATAYQKQVMQLKEALSEKDSALSASESSVRESQREVEALKARSENQMAEIKRLKAAASANDSEEVKNLRAVVFCNCGRGLKDTVITTCGHIVCRECVDDRISTRQRKCPMCMKAFGGKDFMRVHLA